MGLNIQLHVWLSLQSQNKVLPEWQLFHLEVERGVWSVIGEERKGAQRLQGHFCFLYIQVKVKSVYEPRGPSGWSLSRFP